MHETRATDTRMLLCGSRPSLRGAMPRSKALCAAVKWVAPCALSVLASAAAPGCLSFQGEVDEIVVTRHELAFDGTGGLVPTLRGIQTQFFELDGMRVPDGVDADLRPTRLTVTLDSGPADLSFITQLDVTLSCPGTEEPPLFLVFVLDEPVEPGTTAFELAPVERPNVVEYLRCETARYTFTVRGELPEQDWTIDTGVGFSGDFSVSP